MYLIIYNEDNPQNSILLTDYPISNISDFQDCIERFKKNSNRFLKTKIIMYRKLIYLLLIIFIACDSSSDSSSDNQNPTPTNFTVELTSSATTTNVDEEFTVQVNASEPMTKIIVSYDNFATTVVDATSDFGLSKTLKFNFDTLGSKTISVKAYNANNQSTVKTLMVTTNRGSAVKVTGIQVTSFYDMNNTWDPEYPTSDPNHLADVFFGLNKMKIGSPTYGTYGFTKWYTSSIKQNQGDLTWNIAGENLYIKPEKTIRLGLVDMDNPPVGQDLMIGPPDYRDFNLSAYTVTKPTSITFSYPEINLEFVLQVEWPN